MTVQCRLLEYGFGTCHTWPRLYIARWTAISGSLISFSLSSPTLASHFLNGSAFLDGTDCTIRRSVLVFTTSVLRILPSTDGIGNLSVLPTSSLKPSWPTSCFFRSKPSLKRLCILGRYRLYYPEECFSVNRICFTHLPIRGRQFQLSGICGKFTKAFFLNELPLQEQASS